MNEKEQKLLEGWSKLLGNLEVPDSLSRYVEERAEKKKKEEQLLEAFERALLNTAIKIENVENQLPEIVEDVSTPDVKDPVKESFADIKNASSREVTQPPSAATPVQPQPRLSEPDFVTKSVAAISKAVAPEPKEEKPENLPKAIRKELDLIKKSVVDLHSFASRMSQMGGGGAGSVDELYFRTIGVTTNYTCTTKDYYIGVNNSAPCTITLPATAKNGALIVIKDETGSCSINNITIVAQNGASIDNDTSALMEVNNMSLQFIYRNGWRII
jgi:hypothetical protein